MPTIKDKIHFNFDGKWSDKFGVIHVVLDSGMYEETFVATRNIIESKVSGSSKTNFQKIEEEPIEFELNLAFENKFDRSSVDEIIRWLYVDHYRPLYFMGEEGRIFYCMPSGDSKITHNGLSQGYITITMRCDSSNKYSPVSKTPIYTVLGEHTIDIFNDGHMIVYPEISINKIGNGSVIITNQSDGGDFLEVMDLNHTESIYIDSYREIIETDIIGVSRYGDILGEFPRLVYGRNSFKIEGDCKIQFRYQLKYRN